MSDQVVVDFSDVEERDFTPVPRGRYVAEVTDAEIRDGDKYPYLMVEQTVIEGEYADRKLWDNMSFSPKALWKLKGFYRALGATDEELSSAGFDVDPESLLGLTFMIQVAVKNDNNGEPRNVINRYAQLEGDVTSVAV